METIELTPERQATLDRVEADLLSGRTFEMVRTSESGVYGYQPPMGRSQWAHCMTTLGRMAAESGAFAQVATHIFGHVNLYGTKSEARAQVYERAAEALRAGFDDVIGRSGPNAGRYSAYQRDYTIGERIALTYWLNEATSKMQSAVPGVGWCVTLLAEKHHVHTNHITAAR